VLQDEAVLPGAYVGILDSFPDIDEVAGKGEIILDRDGNILIRY